MPLKLEDSYDQTTGIKKSHSEGKLSSKSQIWQNLIYHDSTNSTQTSLPVSLEKQLKEISIDSRIKPLLYGALNIFTATGIVFANKIVFQVFNFNYTVTLTWIHTVFTMVGIIIFARNGLFNIKQISWKHSLSLALSYVAYILMGNLCLRFNTVSFYQITKIAVAPTVMFLEAVFYQKIPTLRVCLSVVIVCIGITFATVTDKDILKNRWGILVGLCSVLSTALYQLWAGTKQKLLNANSSQLLYAYTPQATIILLFMVPLFEPLGLQEAQRKVGVGILNYKFTLESLSAILISSVLGFFVSLSTFLFIGATSSVTYNVVGHIKTILVLLGGFVFFQDSISYKKIIGISITFSGILYYTYLRTLPEKQKLKGMLSYKHDKGEALLNIENGHAINKLQQ